MVSRTPRGFFRRKRPAPEQPVDPLHTLATVLLNDADPRQALATGVPPDDSYDAALYAVESLIQKPHRAVVVTGVSAVASSSDVATGLALVGVAAGRRVVLIDANLGSGQVAASFGLGETTGLSDVLVGSVALGDAVVRPMADRNLLIIPAGRHSAELAGPLPVERASSLLEYLAGAAQLVVIDSDGEALGVPGTGWGPFADGVLLVGDRRVGGGDDGLAVAATIRQAGGHVLGLIRTQVPGTAPTPVLAHDLFADQGEEDGAFELAVDDPEPEPHLAPDPEPEPAPADAEPEPHLAPEPDPEPAPADAEPEPHLAPEPAPEPAPADAEPAPEPEPVPEPQTAPAPEPALADPEPEPKPEPAPAPAAVEARSGLASRPLPEWRTRTVGPPPPPKRPVAEPSGLIESALAAERIAFSKPELSAAARRGALRPGRISDDEPPAVSWRSRPRRRRLRRSGPAPDPASEPTAHPEPDPGEDPEAPAPTATSFDGNWVESALGDAQPHQPGALDQPAAPDPGVPDDSDSADDSDSGEPDDGIITSARDAESLLFGRRQLTEPPLPEWRIEPPEDDDPDP